MQPVRSPTAPRGSLSTALTHAVASGVVVFAALVLAVLGYFGMLAWAVFAGEPIGGALALPFLLLLALSGGAAASLLVLLPATLGAALLCEGPLRWPRVAQIPVATALCVIEVLVLSAAVAAWQGTALAPALSSGLVVALALLVPLGLYWWVLQAGNGLARLFRGIGDRLRGRRAGGRAAPPAP